MSFRDSSDHIAADREFPPSRDAREALMNDYDDPAEVPASVIYAKRSIGTTGATPIALRFAALADDATYEAIPAAALSIIPLPADQSRGAA